MIDHRPITGLRDELVAVWKAKEDSLDAQSILHGVSLSFGAALSRYLDPEDAAKFLRQEARRIEGMYLRPASEARQ